MRGGVRKREMGVDEGKDSELNYQERVTVIWIEKLKTVRSCALYCVEG